MKQLRHAIEDYLYGLNAELDLPLEAAHALVRGLTSPSLAELAGLSTDATYEIRELLPMVTEELSIEVASLPGAVFRKACETAAEYRVGTLEFRSAASRVTALLLDNEYLMFEKRPDMASTVFNDLWRLNGVAVRHGARLPQRQHVLLHDEQGGRGLLQGRSPSSDKLSAPPETTAKQRTDSAVA